MVSTLRNFPSICRCKITDLNLDYVVCNGKDMISRHTHSPGGSMNVTGDRPAYLLILNAQSVCFLAPWRANLDVH